MEQQLTPAQKTVELLRKEYNSNPFAFEMTASVYIGGEQNERKILRQEIAKLLTSKDQPKSRCTQAYISDLIKASLEQIALF